MKDLSKVLFITDMDGTLLPTNKKLNPKDLAAIEKFRHLGGTFTVATGRSIQSATQYFIDLKLNTEPVIVCNGSGIFDCKQKNFSWQKYVDNSAYDIVKKLFEQFPSIGGEVSLDNKILVPRMSLKEQYHLDISYKGMYEQINYDNIPKDKWCKFLFAGEKEEIDLMEKYVSENIYCDLTFVRSSPLFFEILPNDCSKGKALQTMREIYSMNDWTFVGCGDFDNDLEMIQIADIGFAPANAQECVKKAADHITVSDCNNGAIAEALEYVMNIL